MKKFRLGEKRPLIIAGPCSAETREQTIETCVQLAATGVVDMLRAGVWKPRTQPGSFEGAGLSGLGWLVEARHLTGLPIAVEVASARHVEAALKSDIDLVWIGARTTVSPFSVQEIAEALRGSNVAVLVKNPLNPDIELWAGAVERLTAVGIGRENIGLVHRGFSYFGHGRYRNEPMWPLAFEMRSRFPETVMLADPSHIAGKSEYIYELSQAAADLNYDGLIVESHCRPCEALSDARQQLTPPETGEILGRVDWRAAATDDPAFGRQLALFREEIDLIDTELLEILVRRMRISEQIGRVKKENGVAILQSERWSAIRRRILSQAEPLGLSHDFLNKILDAIHIESIERQNSVMQERTEGQRPNIP
jgi:chorismate mutase